jgi:hypothetical protein
MYTLCGRRRSFCFCIFNERISITYVIQCRTNEKAFTVIPNANSESCETMQFWRILNLFHGNLPIHLRISKKKKKHSRKVPSRPVRIYNPIFLPVTCQLSCHVCSPSRITPNNGQRDADLSNYNHNQSINIASCRQASSHYHVKSRDGFTLH